MIEPSGKPIDVVLFGLGALGSLVVDCITTGYPLIRVVGAVDRAPGKAGQPLAELFPAFAAARGTQGLVVRPTLAACLAGLQTVPALVYHMTESVLSQIEGQLTEAMTAGLNVISASEAMFHPALRFPDVAARLDACAEARGVSITGVGINPGFSFDALPLMLARTTCDVRRVAISRTIDVTGTGPGDIDHVGYGLEPEEFRAGIASGRIVGHMGGPESIASIAERLDLDIDRVEEAWETATAVFPVDSGTPMLGMIEPGRVIGITQTGRGMRGNETVVSTRLAMYYEPERFGLESIDTIDIEGAHHVRASLRPAAVSLFGAANTIVNASHDVVAAEPGLVSVLDFSLAGTRRGGTRYAVDSATRTVPGIVRLKRVAI